MHMYIYIYIHIYIGRGVARLGQDRRAGVPAVQPAGCPSYYDYVL